VHQVRLVEGILVELDGLGLAHQHLRGLRQAGQQFVRGLGREDHRLLGARAVLADRVHVLVEVVEGRVRQPGFVEVQGVDFPVQHFAQGLDVVHHAVVGRLGDGQDARLLVDGFARERVRFDLAGDRFGRELFERDRADDAEVIPGRHQEHGDRAAHDDRVQDRLVAVTVDDHDVARGDGRVPHHLVRGRGAVGDEVAVVGAVDARGIAFGLGDRAGMVQQLAQFLDRVADVGAQHVLAEELVEHLADRRLEEGDAARVARAVPRVGTVVGVVDQRAEERRRQAVQVGLGFADDVARDEFRRVLEHVDEAVQLLQDVVRDVAAGAGLAVDIDRDVGVLVADLLHERAQAEQRGVGLLDRTAAEFLVVDRQHEGGCARLLLGELGQVAIAGHTDDLHAFLFHRGSQCANAETGGVLRAEVLVNDDDGETKFHRQLQCEAPCRRRALARLNPEGPAAARHR